MAKIEERVVTELLKTVTAAGPKKTIEALQEARQNINPKIDFVIKMVCECLVLVFDDLVNEKTYSDNINYGRGFIVFYLRRDLDIDWKEICALLHRKQNSLWKSYRLIKDLNPGSKFDQPWIAHRNTMNDKMKKLKKSK